MDRRVQLVQRRAVWLELSSAVQRLSQRDGCSESKGQRNLSMNCVYSLSLAALCFWDVFCTFVWAKAVSKWEMRNLTLSLVIFHLKGPSFCSYKLNMQWIPCHGSSLSDKISTLSKHISFLKSWFDLSWILQAQLFWSLLNPTGSVILISTESYRLGYSELRSAELVDICPTVDLNEQKTKIIFTNLFLTDQLSKATNYVHKVLDTN